MKVQEYDFGGLVRRLADTMGVGEVKGVLVGALRELGDPRFETEKIYFWRALANEARHYAVETGDHQVWLWLCVEMPGLNPTNFVMPDLVPDWEIPEIRETDEPARAVESVRQWPSELTEENCRAQARRLQEILDEQNAERISRGEGSGLCQNVDEYVNTFRDSGTGQISASMQLARLGLMALSTQEGLNWLIQNYQRSPSAV